MCFAGCGCLGNLQMCTSSRRACSPLNAVDSHERDLAEIETLRRKDVEAALAGDQAALGEGMTELRSRSPEGKASRRTRRRLWLVEDFRQERW
jgi:hypothetical protein